MPGARGAGRAGRRGSAGSAGGKYGIQSRRLCVVEDLSVLGEEIRQGVVVLGACGGGLQGGEGTGRLAQVMSMLKTRFGHCAHKSGFVFVDPLARGVVS